MIESKTIDASRSAFNRPEPDGGRARGIKSQQVRKMGALIRLDAGNYVPE